MRSRSVSRRWTCGLLAAALAATAPSAAWAADEVPRLEAGTDGVFLTRLPPILDDEEVRGHLRTGLTTTFALRLEVRPPAGRSREPDDTAFVTVRYELWDEVFHVGVVDASGRPRSLQVDTFAGLEAFWRDLRLAMSASAVQIGAVGRVPGEVRLAIDVVPFSAAEAQETQRWFSETLEDAKRSSAEDVSSSAESSSDTLSRSFRLMMATSIRRRSIHVLRFDLHVVRLRPESGVPP